MTFQRSISTTITPLIGKKLDVGLAGSITVVDYMGNDRTPAEAARVSYGGHEYTPKEDFALVHFLMRNKHTSPFEMCRLRLNVRLPIFVARQWVRHRQASLNEVSLRYVTPDKARDEPDQLDFFVPALETIAGPPPKGKNKQGRDEAGKEEFHGASAVQERITRFQKYAFEFYKSLVAGRSTYPNSMRNTEDTEYSNLHDPLAPELARMVLPLGTFTKVTWASDLHNLFHFLRLRTDPHAQGEFREYANVISWIVKQWVPCCWAAWAESMQVEDVKTLFKPPLNVNDLQLV